jgi:Flp pilus assembly pilin Flp
MILRNLNKKLKNKKGQTALEYALVVAAVSLVIMAAWNVVGKQVKEAITGSMLSNINDQLTKGNATFKK